MQNTRFLCRLSLSLIACMLLTIPLHAYSLKHYTTKDGLSNNAITTIFQDQDGFMWFGTNRGVKQFDGLAFHNLPAIEGADFLVSDAIGSVYETENHVFWILTDGGLARLDYLKQSVRRFEEFDLNSKVIKGPGDEIYVVKEDNFVYCFRKEGKEFEKIPANGLNKEKIISMFVDSSNTLWVISEDDNHRCYSIEDEEGKLKLTSVNGFRHVAPVLWCFYENDEIYFIDDSFTLFEYNLTDKTKHYIQDLRNEVARYGDISSIIKHQGDYYLAFAAGGMFRVKNMPDHKSKYLLTEINVPAGINCLVKDKKQDIVWIATRDKGVFMYYQEASSLEGTLSGSFAHSITNPINDLFIDRGQTLWIATGGNGILNIHEFDVESSKGKQSDWYSTHNSIISSSIVHSLAPSSRNIFWIGTENGVNYYSYADRRVKTLQIVADGKPVRYVRSICELNDTTLWISTAGEGIVKVRIAGVHDAPVVATAKRYVFGEGNKELNDFTSSYKEDNSTLWFGTQGKGVYKVDSNTGKMDNIQFGKNGDPLNDVYAILKTTSGYWFGTGGGLVNLAPNGEKRIFTESNGFLHNSVHGILEGKNDILWLSTNRGIVKYDVNKHSFYLCKQTEDKKIVNFSNEASYKDRASGMLLFGGSNGFVTINESEFALPDYSPEIKFTGLSLFGQDQNIYEHLSTKRGKSTLELSNNQNVFAISFVAPDYIDGKDYTYFYKLNEQNDNWINNGSSNTAFFTYLASGTYTFMAKYRNNISGKESKEFPVTIYISHPWYKTWWAYLIYIAVAVLAFYITRWFIGWRNRKNLKELETVLGREHEEDIYKSKLEFFTNMANQLYTSLAFILNPSKKILNDAKPGSKVQVYADVINQSGERMNRFVHELVEFRQIVTGDRTAQIRPLPVSELADAIAEAFIEQAEAKQLNYKIAIDNGLFWNTDYYCLTQTLSHLLSVSFANVPNKGMASVKLTALEEELQIVVSSNAAELFEKNFERALDRWKIVDLLEEDVVKGLPVSTELTLALCNSMVMLLNGKMDIHKSEGTTSFVVNLPLLEAVEEEKTVIEDELPVIKPVVSEIVPAALPVETVAALSTVLVLTNNDAIVWLLSEQFAGKYNVQKVTTEEAVFSKLKPGKYSLFITEVNMEGVNTLQLVENIKKREELAAISCVLLAADNSIAEKTKALEVADLYLPKPYDMELLDKEVDNLSEYKELQQHYTSALSQTLELDDAHFENEEDKKFYDKILQVVEQNVANEELSVEMLSTELGLSTHQLYRRLKSITEKTPNEIIREYRLNTVERLLVSTNLSVEEIMEKAGFTSQGNFLQLFSQKHSMTPKAYRDQKKMSMKKRK